DPALPLRCNTCHAPLAEQQDDAALRAEGVTCAACHVREGHKLGPPVPVHRRLPAPGMAARPEPRFARSDFCLPCHNLPLDVAVAGRPLLDTWREWAASPYLPAGVQCQHCHQPDGRHHFRGVHDVAFVRGAVELRAHIEAGDALRVVAEVQNIGAGHHFPTTATPRAVLRVRQLGLNGPLAGTEALWALGRTVEWSDGWREVADTRVPASGVATRRYTRSRAAGATAIEVSLHIFPDWYYARFYRGRLARTDLPAAARADFAAALAEAEASAQLVDVIRLPLP
ncbi:MAG: hypothetical protein KC620_21070, partial [Myxococcales bacterium]|nr:hypothetical protein [Myxococcales bacterium]